jgi:hypothetical protein
VSINSRCVAHTSFGRRPCGWRRVAVPFVAPPEAQDRVATGPGPVARARPALLKLPSPAEVSVARRVAPRWLRALPPHRFCGLGVFLGVPDSRNCRPVSSSRGVRLLFRARPRRVRPCSPSPHRLACAHRLVPGISGLPLLGFLPPRNASTSGAPARRDGFEAVPEGEGRQAFTGAVLRVLAPLDGSGCARGTARTLAEPAVTPWRPDASRPCYMPLASLWSCPTELSLPEEPFLLSQAVASLRVRTPTTASAA